VPELRPQRRLDYELELGVLRVAAERHGRADSDGSAEEHVFGSALFNDWTARDVQSWEYQPLGPS
jgi:fumarylacetoacetase